jgi:hypothetical protein
VIRSGDILSYLDLQTIEKAQLQRGMNFRSDGRHSVFLMSQRDDAPYTDQLADDGKALIYEGEDVVRSKNGPQPDQVDQILETTNGTLTGNGKFFRAAVVYKSSGKLHIIAVYEKLKKGIWVFNGLFRLEDAWLAKSGARHVYKFKLGLYSEVLTTDSAPPQLDLDHTRVIPSHVKQLVYKRDQGKCRMCGATDNLHYDHELPYSKGGTSLLPENIQLLCARHNLQKRDKIE